MLRSPTALVACLLLAASPVWAATITLPAVGDLWPTVHGATAGDVVLLPDGNFGAVEMDDFVFSGVGVTVRAAPGAHPVFSGLHLDRSSGLSFQGIEIAMAAGQKYGVYAFGSSHLAFDGLVIRQADGSLGGVGAFFRESSDVSLTNSELHHLGVGASVMDTLAASIVGNRFHDIGVDGVDLAGDPGARVALNTFTDFHALPGEHPDVIQTWNTTCSATVTVCHPMPAGMVLEDNVYRRGLGDATLPPQGIFVEWATNVTIRDNALGCTLANGISLSGVQTGLIEGNFDQGCADFGSRIIVRGGSDGVIVRGNWISQPVLNLVQAGEPVNTNFTDGGGQTSIPGIATPAPGVAPDTTLLDQWVADHIPGTPVTPPVTPPVVVDPRDAQIAALTAQAANLNTQIATLTQAANDNAAKLATATSAASASATQVQTLTAQLASLTAADKAQIAALNSQIASLTTQLNASSITTLKAQIAAKTKALTGIAVTATTAAK